MHALTRLSLSRPRAILTLLGAVTLSLGAGTLRLETDVGYRSLLGADHPAVVRFDTFLGRFGGGFPLAAVWSCEETPRCTSVFDPDALAMAADVAGALAAEPSIRRVESPATTPLLVPGDDGPVARFLFSDGAPARDRARLAVRALDASLWPRQLVNETGTVGAVVLEVASSTSAANRAAYAALDAALAPHERAGYRFHRVGGPVEFVVAGDELAADTRRLVPAMVGIVATVLLVLFRSATVAGAALVTVGISVLWAFGLMGWLGWPENAVSQALPPLLLVIGVCDAIHLLARYASEAGAAPERPREALLGDVVRDIGRPCLATSLTTAAGFASFATSGLASFVRFGAIAAFGVMSAWLLTFTLLPILAARLRPDGIRAAHASQAWDHVLRRVVDAARAHALAVLVLSAIVASVFASGFARLRVDASFEDLYGEDSQVVRWAHFVGDRLRRPDSLEVEVVAPGADVHDPATLRVVEGVGEGLAAIPGLGPARSLADPVSLVNQLASGGDPFWYRVPDLASDLREILELLAERDENTLRHWLDADGPAFRISVEAEKPPQDEMRRIFAEVDAVLLARLPAGWSARLTGPLAIVHDMVDEIQRTQLASFATAGVVVLVLASIFLGSARYGILALVPTVLPVVVTLGAMGLAGASLDVGSAMVAAVVIGIAVDDAIHLLAQYGRRRAEGSSRPDAMHEAVLHVGRAVATTSIALALGFAALTLSSWQTISAFGGLAATAILCALVAVLVVLPALVTVFRGRSGRAPTAVA
jgi:predicted RND superfamily exporter protein